MGRTNVTEELLASTLTLDVDQQLELALQSVAPTIRAIHAIAKTQRILDADTLDMLAKAVGILLRIRSKVEPGDDSDVTKMSEAELRKAAKK